MLRENIENGEPVPFKVLMDLEKLDDCSYKSRTKGFRPGAPSKEHWGTYGGHVYSQAVYAASHTVHAEFVVSLTKERGKSVTGYFMLAGDPEHPFNYNVRVVRDGKSFCVRAVDATQEHTKGICFTCTCSFKRGEYSPLEFQQHVSIREKFGSILSGRPDDQPDAPSTESLWFKQSKEAMANQTPFPGLVTKKVNVDAYNAERLPLDRRQLMLYKVLGSMPPVKEAPNLHACAHLYASDRNSLYAIVAHLEIEKNIKQLASLNHTVIFHTSGEALDMGDPETGEANWFLQQAWTTRVGDGRGLHQSAIRNYKTGTHIATTMQDGLFRMGFESEEERERAKRQIESGRPKM